MSFRSGRRTIPRTGPTGRKGAQRVLPRHASGTARSGRHPRLTPAPSAAAPEAELTSAPGGRRTAHGEPAYVSLITCYSPAPGAAVPPAGAAYLDALPGSASAAPYEPALPGSGSTGSSADRSRACRQRCPSERGARSCRGVRDWAWQGRLQLLRDVTRLSSLKRPDLVRHDRPQGQTSRRGPACRGLVPLPPQAKGRRPGMKCRVRQRRARPRRTHLEPMSRW